jgi:hypothetical protein
MNESALGCHLLVASRLALSKFTLFISPKDWGKENILSGLCQVPPVYYIQILEGRHYHLHFTDGESEAQSSVIIQL